MNDEAKKFREKLNNKIILSDAAINGIKETTTEKMQYDKNSEYQKLIDEANERIEVSRKKEAKAAVKGRYVIAQEKTER